MTRPPRRPGPTWYAAPPEHGPAVTVHGPDCEEHLGALLTALLANPTPGEVAHLTGQALSHLTPLGAPPGMTASRYHFLPQREHFVSTLVTCGWWLSHQDLPSATVYTLIDVLAPDPPSPLDTVFTQMLAETASRHIETAVQTRDFPPHILLVLCGHSSPAVRAAASGHPRCPEEGRVLAALLPTQP